MKLCVGVITFNRLESLSKLVSQIKSLTACEFDLVIAEGGGTDNTVQWCLENGLRVITGPNLGIARSKNSILYYFLNHTDCDQVVILEDDCRVWERGWEQEWMLACKAWEHVNWPLSPTQEYEYGCNTPGSPIRTNWFGGHCTITSRGALEKVGYLDPRFIGYGGEHAEWTWRFYRLLVEQWKEPCDRNKTVPCLSSHVGVEFKDSLFDKEIYKKNMALMYELMEKDATIYRDPWRNDTEREDFQANITRAVQLKVENAGVAGMRCPLCSGLGSKIGEKDGVHVRQCCGVMLSWSWESEAAYESFYADGQTYHVDQQIKEGQKAYWERDGELVAASLLRLEWIRQLRPMGRTIVDIGAGTGAFVHAAGLKGYTAIGIDPNGQMCKEAAVRGRKIKKGTWKDIDWQYDIVALIDVFEHLTRPKECLERIKQHIAPGGVVYVEMPEAGCRQNIEQKLDWKHVRPQQHLALYSDHAARQMFYIAGYQVEFSLRPFQGALGKIVYGLSV
jgi:SAM-dependent methyltransferase